MPDARKHARTESDTVSNLEVSHVCPICQRTFPKESTRKRHYYYCRSKPQDASTSRRRSCTACVRAKTRCIESVDLHSTGESCVRCDKRGLECDIDAAVPAARRARRAAHEEVAVVSALDTSQSDEDASVIGPGTLTVAGRLSGQGSKGSQLPTPPEMERQPYSETSVALSTVQDVWKPGSLTDPDALNFDDNTTPVDDMGMDVFMAFFDGQVSNVPSSPSPWDFDLPLVPLFGHRNFNKPFHSHLVSLIMRILKSYPYMMLHKATLPPFVHPLVFSWAQSGVGHPQQALMTCILLVDLFKSRKGSDRNMVWKLIRLEQERILAEHTSLDRWEHLAALQALLVYCLLRLQEVPVGHDGLEAGLLTTVNIVFNGLVAAAGGIKPMKHPDDPNIAWIDWIYSESRRRTALIFQIVNILVELTTEASSYASCGLVLIPLPSNAALWASEDADTWKAEFKARYSNERYLYGVSQTGDLMKLLLEEGGGARISTEEWEDWRADVGEIGTLVMMIGSLL